VFSKNAATPAGEQNLPGLRPPEWKKQKNREEKREIRSPRKAGKVSHRAGVEKKGKEEASRPAEEGTPAAGAGV